MVPRAWVGRFLLPAVLLPAAIVVLAALGRLLRAMGDAAAGIVLDRVSLAVGVAWIFVLLGLLLVVAARHMAEDAEE